MLLINDEMIYEIDHILNCGYEIKWSCDPRIYERNFFKCSEKPEKFRLSTGFDQWVINPEYFHWINFLHFCLFCFVFFVCFSFCFLFFVLVFAILGAKHYTGFSSDLFPNFIKSFFKKVAIAFVIYFVLLQLTTHKNLHRPSDSCSDFYLRFSTTDWVLSVISRHLLNSQHTTVLAWNHNLRGHN